MASVRLSSGICTVAIIPVVFPSGDIILFASSGCFLAIEPLVYQVLRVLNSLHFQLRLLSQLSHQCLKLVESSLLNPLIEYGIFQVFCKFSISFKIFRLKYISFSRFQDDNNIVFFGIKLFPPDSNAISSGFSSLKIGAITRIKI